MKGLAWGPSVTYSSRELTATAHKRSFWWLRYIWEATIFVFQDRKKKKKKATPPPPQKGIIQEFYCAELSKEALLIFLP